MARIKNGVNGAFSGKVGSVVGSNWRDVDYIRGRSRRSLKKTTDKQSEARRNFSLLVKFLDSLRIVVDQGFKNQDTRKATAFNLATQANYPVFENLEADSLPDYARVVLCKGNLVGKPAGCALSVVGEGMMRITWNMYGHSPLERGVDQATIVLYCPSLQESLILKDRFFRQDLQAEVDLPGPWLNQSVCVYMFMTSMEDQHSDSVFVGFFTW